MRQNSTISRPTPTLPKIMRSLLFIVSTNSRNGLLLVLSPIISETSAAATTVYAPAPATSASTISGLSGARYVGATAWAATVAATLASVMAVLVVTLVQ